MKVVPMTARKARQILQKLDRKDSILHRRRFFGGYGEIDDLQRARNLLIDCLLEIQMSRLTYSQQLWVRVKTDLASWNIRSLIDDYQQLSLSPVQILELYQKLLLTVLKDIQSMV
jgi:hypothetical protein